MAIFMFLVSVEICGILQSLHLHEGTTDGPILLFRERQVYGKVEREQPVLSAVCERLSDSELGTAWICDSNVSHTIMTIADRNHDFGSNALNLGVARLDAAYTEVDPGLFTNLRIDRTSSPCGQCGI